MLSTRETSRESANTEAGINVTAVFKNKVYKNVFHSHVIKTIIITVGV